MSQILAQGRVDAAIAEAYERFEKARTTMVLDQFQLGALAMGLKLLADPSCRTAWVDGRSLGFNPRFVLSLSWKALVALVAHEVLHVALGHPWRRGNRDPKRWNIACDKAINTLLREFGFELPDGAYYAEKDEVGQSAEWIYDHMPFEQPKEQPQPQLGDDEPEDGESESEDESEPGDEPGEDESEDTGEGEGESDEDGEAGDESEDGEGTGQSDEEGEGDGEGEGTGPGDELGEVRDAPQDTDADGDGPPSEDEWKERLGQAVALGKGQGLGLGEAMTRAVEQVMQPRIDIKSLVLRWMQERSASNYNWMKPNARYAGSGFFFPKLQSTQMGEMAIVIDTSGSIDQVALGRALGIVQECIEEVEPADVTLWFADDKVCHSQRLERGDDLIWEPRGGWGTDFRPALEAIDQDENQPICTVFITDLYGTFPEVEPDVPVLWLSTTRNEAPFGETVYVGW